MVLFSSSSIAENHAVTNIHTKSILQVHKWTSFPNHERDLGNRGQFVCKRTSCSPQMVRTSRLSRSLAAFACSWWTERFVACADWRVLTASPDGSIRSLLSICVSSRPLSLKVFKDAFSLNTSWETLDFKSSRKILNYVFTIRYEASYSFVAETSVFFK